MKIEKILNKIINKLKRNEVRSIVSNRINTAINIPLYDLNSKAYSILPNKNSTIILYCQSGTRSIQAYKILENMGYTNLYNLDGGINNI